MKSRLTGSISVVIPTIWAANGLPERVIRVADCPSVREVILIDNAHNLSQPVLHEKVKILVQSQNIFVNPAWNLGASKAAGSFLCLLNDDLEFREDTLVYGASILAKHSEIGLVGLNWDCPRGVLMHQSVPDRTTGGFGCFMMLRLAEYKYIPKSLKIWHGDDWLIQSFLLVRQKVVEVSGFADAPQVRSIATNKIRSEIDEIIRADSLAWHRYLYRWLLLRHATARGLKDLLMASVRTSLRLIGLMRKDS